MRDSIKLLVAAGFSRSEIEGFDVVNRIDYIASGILEGVACDLKPGIYHDEEFKRRDPFDAVAAMTEDQKRELREFADPDFSEFMGEQSHE